MRVVVGEGREWFQVEAVLVDGVPVNLCVAADDEEGWAECYLDVEAHPYCGPNGELPTVRRRGEVEFVWRDDAGG